MRCDACEGRGNDGAGHDCGTCDGQGEFESCDICTDGGEECSACGGDGLYGEYDATCYGCYGSGWRVPEHCCACGGSPYCDCCKRCGQCVATCACPISVTLDDGTVQVIGGAS